MSRLIKHPYLFWTKQPPTVPVKLAAKATAASQKPRPNLKLPFTSEGFNVCE